MTIELEKLDLSSSKEVTRWFRLDNVARMPRLTLRERN